MIELEHDRLVFSFPEAHPDARLSVDFQRTLRIPDDGRDHFLPPGLGSFPLRHVDDFRDAVPPSWIRHGGVMLPIYQAEALWLNFSSPGGYPMAVKVAAGKVNAVTGEEWSGGIHRNPQDYLSVPRQPWLDGYAVDEGVIRQFVAMPLGDGYSAEEQLTGEGEHGGLQISVYPLRAEVWERIKRSRRGRHSRVAESVVAFSMASSPDMGLAPGGRMRQQIYDDPHDLEDWDRRSGSRCFVHMANSLVWRAITGEGPPTTAPTAREYTEAGLPWFDYYAADQEALAGSDKLARMKSVLEKAREDGGNPLPENESAPVDRVIRLGDRRERGRVREGSF